MGPGIIAAENAYQVLCAAVILRWRFVKEKAKYGNHDFVDFRGVHRKRNESTVRKGVWSAQITVYIPIQYTTHRLFLYPTRNTRDFI